ncbi:MAG: hypothetical protein M1284_02380 [Candidatus Parvarchaeota archaeon]|jgi:hypothetical protein|nr:hypothetical protein [Candidatus Parvarchaeota archaeon]MCL5420579.1 hypothetical protein [Candidatus Parvarchaeota archaeon]
MESQIIKDSEIAEIKEDNTRVRFVGKIMSFDEKTGMFEVEDGNSRVTCLPNYQESTVFQVSDLVMVTGRVIAADSSFEVRADIAEKININDYNNYKKYLKIRNNLLTIDGS